MVRVLGFRGNVKVLHDIFSLLDDDATGALTFDELLNWVQGRAMTGSRRANAVAQLALHIRPEDPPWDADRLRTRLRALVGDSGVEIIDLLETFDSDGSGLLRKREWLYHFKRLLNPIACAADTPAETREVMGRVWYTH